MERFLSFVKPKSDRIRHFSWENCDLETSLEEWTSHAPHEIGWENNYSKPDYKQTHPAIGRPKFGSETRNHYEQHDKSLTPVQRQHMHYYKADSYSTNRWLRQGIHDEVEHRNNPEWEASLHNHINHLDKITSFRTPQHHIVFRGGIAKDVHDFKPGLKFQDHGYTGTSFSPGVAKSFTHYDEKYRGVHGRKVVHVIHVPKGTKAHYFDVGHGTPVDEHELVLHRGTKFKVTHHSTDGEYHYIHSRVVAQHPKDISNKLPTPAPGKWHSELEHSEHLNAQHSSINIKVNPVHAAAAKKAHNEHLKKMKIAQSMEKAKS